MASTKSSKNATNTNLKYNKSEKLDYSNAIKIFYTNLERSLIFRRTLKC